MKKPVGKTKRPQNKSVRCNPIKSSIITVLNGNFKVKGFHVIVEFYLSLLPWTKIIFFL